MRYILLAVYLLFLGCVDAHSEPFFPADSTVSVNGTSVQPDGAWSTAGITQYKLYRNSSLVSTQAVTDSYGPYALAGLEWISANAIKPNGAIIDAKPWPGFNWASNFPYFGHFVGEALLLRNPTATKNWLKWYMDHTQWPDYSGVNGAVYDYNYSGNTETSYGDYDSIDSYPSLFFRLLKKYHQSGGDITWLNSYSGPGGRTGRQVIDGIANAMLYTWRPDLSMTRAKNLWGPSNLTLFSTMYLMDNTETYQGCLGAAYVYTNIFSDSTTAAGYSSKASLVQAAEDSVYWQKSVSGRYSWSYNGSSYGSFNNSLVWPDWVTNLSMIAWEVLDPKSSRAQTLWSAFKTYHPNFATLGDSEQSGYSNGFLGPWPWSFVAVVAAKVGDTAWLNTYLSSVKSTYTSYGGSFGAFNIAEYEAAARIYRQPVFTVAGLASTDVLQLVATDANGGTTALNFTGDGIVTGINQTVGDTAPTAATHRATMSATFR